MTAKPGHTGTTRVEALRNTSLKHWSLLNQEKSRLLHAYAQEHFDVERTAVFAARQLRYMLRHLPVKIGDGELIVGHIPSRMPTPAELRRLQTDSVSFASRVPAWAPMRTFFPPEVFALLAKNVLHPAGNHQTANFRKVLSVGIAGIVAEIETVRQGLPPESPDHQFLEALRITADAIVEYAHRHRDEALALSRNCPDPQRAHELIAIADNCDRVPLGKPDTFWAACQSLFFIFLVLPDSPGRPDHALYPFFRRDRDVGRLDEDGARELLSCLWIKIFDVIGSQDSRSGANHLVLGGQTSQGEDASSDLTRLCLDVTETLGLPRPQVSLRWHSGMDRAVVRRAVQVLRNNMGQPSFINDETVIPALEEIGTERSDARNYSLSGCSEVIITGMSNMGSVEGHVNVVEILLTALGLTPDVYAVEPDSITTFDQFTQTFEDVVAYYVEQLCRYAYQRDARAAADPALLSSLLVDDCIQNRRSYARGGARYNHCNFDLIGIANVIDSLYVIKELVFERGDLSLSSLVDALRNDWAGEEALRSHIRNQMPHYGNGDPAVDRFGSLLTGCFHKAFSRHTPFRGGTYTLGTLGGYENAHLYFGRHTGASPDGRKRGETLSNSLGPMQGCDRSGVTSMLNSVAALPCRLLPTSTILNVKIGGDRLGTPEGVETIVSLIEGHFRSGGRQFQFNLVDRKTLLKAKEEPEGHADLMVRVAGYAARFTTLGRELQDEIIARTEY